MHFREFLAWYFVLNLFTALYLDYAVPSNKSLPSPGLGVVLSMFLALPVAIVNIVKIVLAKNTDG